ncbi:hypothetical protein IW261DRAFT_1667877 [Armillaria novae-zelandiae]|uniref:DUF1308 domain-containing protein n=1 Tax=Armillaria novae-zelandiae TaxID=153914 RepID=A0AA39PHW4_9AGAR|nr:hypothetical protein IW261DRAFT_1667877 [Armillaria novae-zelandiae]
MNSHPTLRVLRTRLQAIHDSISRFQPPTRRPPILDSSLDLNDTQWLQQDHIPGLRKLKDSIKIDLDVLDKFLEDPKSANLPPLSTNAPYLIAVWNEVLCAPARILSVFKSFSSTPPPSTPVPRETRKVGSQKPSGTKVDVVADHGRCWIRVNTIKNSRILAEFREIDSYLTDSSDEEEVSDEEEITNGIHRPSRTLAQTEFDNSILRMGRALVEAAKANTYEVASVDGINRITPRVTLRLTRLDPSETSEDGKPSDPRIAQTIQCLHDMGIDVALGERQDNEIPIVAEPPPFAPVPLKPTRRINLDLSVLIALVSDLTHASLPQSIDEANTRFIPPPRVREWRQKKDVSALEDGLDELTISSDLAKHSRALTNQVLQEMVKGMIQEISDRLPGDNVEFWTTEEAKERCLRIVSKIGGPNEKRRAQALFLDPATTDAENLFWQSSRYAKAFIPILPIHLYPEDGALMPTTPVPSFFHSLRNTCLDILSLENTSAHTSSRAVITKANPRLTAHTVQSMLWGARLGWTTLTANRTSVRAILKEMEVRRKAAESSPVQEEPVESADAALWIVDPRSLAEGMRSDS